jgi:DedD protein
MNVEQDVVERTAGRLHRVRVGPYTERSEADAAIGKIKSTNNTLSPRVVDLRPSDSAPVSTPSDPLVRWVVQVGSFSSAESADSQVAELRLAGLAAYAEEVTSSKGSVYKVRVGPEVNRDKATELAKRIKAEQKLDGFVTTQE